MSSLFLVRHGQASFGAQDYDNLSPKGHQQSVRLGQHWARRYNLDSDSPFPFDAVLVGSLRRHAQTYAGICEGLGQRIEPLVWPGLNEYDAEAMIRAAHPEPLPHPSSPETYRLHFQVLRQGLLGWMEGKLAPEGMPSYPDFLHGVTSALDHVRGLKAERVLIVSSGGPISTAVAHVLQAPAAMSVELNLRIRNTAVSEFHFNPKRHSLISYNTLPHLDERDDAALITHA